MSKLMAFLWAGRLKVTVATGGLESIRIWSFNTMISYFGIGRNALVAAKASIASRHKGVITEIMKEKNNGGQDARR